MYKVAKKFNSNRSRSKYKRVRNCIATSLRTAKSHFFEDLTSKLSQLKDFWTALQKLSLKQDRIPFDLHLNSTTASATQDKTKFLNSHFSSCFTPATNTLSLPNIPLSPDLSNPSLEKVSCTHDEVFKYLSTWKTNRATSPDSISSHADDSRNCRSNHTSYN